MNHLLRELAPMSDTAWSAVEDEAATRLRAFLAARKLVDFNGPLGWNASSVNVGRAGAADDSLADGVQARVREVLPLVELRTPFALRHEVLDAIDRGAPDPDLGPVVDAARQAALAEDRAALHGHAASGIAGITEATPHDALITPDDFEQFPTAVARAIAVLRDAGVGGPYAVALGPQPYTNVIETTYGGYPVLNHVRLLLDGPVVWTSAVDCAVVLSVRGGDFELSVGQDLSLGYLAHDAETVHLYLEESIAFRALSPEAAVELRFG
jgi:uncharacterized linocin/CFP29 family protein